MLWGISEMVNARAFKPFAIRFSTPENLIVGISWVLVMKESYFPALKHFWDNAIRYLRNSEY